MERSRRAVGRRCSTCGVDRDRYASAPESGAAGRSGPVQELIAPTAVPDPPPTSPSRGGAAAPPGYRRRPHRPGVGGFTWRGLTSVRGDAALGSRESSRLRRAIVTDGACSTSSSAIPDLSGGGGGGRTPSRERGRWWSSRSLLQSVREPRRPRPSAPPAAGPRPKVTGTAVRVGTAAALCGAGVPAGLPPHVRTFSLNSRLRPSDGKPAFSLCTFYCWCWPRRGPVRQSPERDGAASLLDYTTSSADRALVRRALSCGQRDVRGVNREAVEAERVESARRPRRSDARRPARRRASSAPPSRRTTT